MPGRSALDRYLFSPYQTNAVTGIIEESGAGSSLKIPNTNAVGHSILRHQSIQSDSARDVRCGILQEEPRTVFSELLSSEHKDDVKTAYDYWNFLEPFFVPLHPGLFEASEISGEAASELLDSSVLLAAQAALSVGEGPHFSAVWAVEDVVNWTEVEKLAVTRMGGALQAASHSVTATRTSLLNSFRPTQKTRRQLEMDGFFQAASRLSEFQESSKALFEVLRRAMEMSGEAEIASQISRRKIFDTLVSFAKHQLARLRAQHVADAVEEFFVDEEGQRPETGVLAVFEDMARIRVRRMTVASVKELLNFRASEVGDVGEFRASEIVWPEESGQRVGPFCHICREAKSAMYKCYAKRRCARRFCGDCLRLHNLPQPSTITGSWNCTVCAHLCTCDRCVRQVYIESAETFLNGCGAEKGKCEFPGEEAQMEEVVKKFPESHFAKSFVKANTSPIKRQASNAVVTATLAGAAATLSSAAPSVGEDTTDLQFLTTVQQGRLRENERLTALAKTLTGIKNEHNKRIGNLKNMLKIAKSQIDQNADCDLDSLVKEFFPNPRLTVTDVSDLPQDTALLARYFALLDSLTTKAKRARTLPVDSDTDDDLRDHKRIRKFQQIQEIEGSVDYLTAIAPVGTTVDKKIPHQHLNVAFSAGLVSAKIFRAR